MYQTLFDDSMGHYTNTCISHTRVKEQQNGPVTGILITSNIMTKTATENPEAKFKVQTR